MQFVSSRSSLSRLSAGVFRSLRWSLRVRDLSATAVLAVTDLEYYREVDSSHLHLKEAQSGLRKFLLKLEERKRLEEDILRRRQLGEETARPTEINDLDDDHELPVQEYIERGPTDILRAIAQGIPRDPTGPDYRFHDDPYLIPYSHTRRRTFLFSKEGGRRTARYILDNHPELFLNNLIEDSPKVQAFMPRAIFSEKRASEELLCSYIAGFAVNEAAEVYRSLVRQDKKVSSETKQALLELLAFYNEEEALDEDLVMGAFGTKTESTTWKEGGLAEEIYSQLDPVTPEAKCALLCGMVRHGHFARGHKLVNQCGAEDIVLSTDGYNAAIRCVSQEDGLAMAWPKVLDILKEMKDKGVPVNEGTTRAILKWLRSCSVKDYSTSCQLALSSMSEFKSIGIRFSLGVYLCLIQVFCRRGFSSCAPAIDILNSIKGQDWTRICSEDDLDFLPIVMTIASIHNSLTLAYQLNDLVATGHNELLLADLNNAYQFYRRFLAVVLRHEPVDVFMEHYSRLVPHIYSPICVMYKDILSQIKSQGGYMHLPKIWTDMTTSSFSEAKKEVRLEVTQLFLEVALEVPNLQSEPYLSQPLYEVCNEAVRDVMDRTDDAKFGLRENALAAPICDLAIKVSMTATGDLSLASRVLEFFLKEVDRTPGMLREETVSNVFTASCNAGDKELAKMCALYGAAVGHSGSSDHTRKLADQFELDELDKKQLNSIFSHEMQ